MSARGDILLYRGRKFRLTTSIPAVVIAAVPPALRLKAAMQAAIEAYAKTGKMLDAALAIVAHDIPVFPVDAKTKKPVRRATAIRSPGKRLPGPAVSRRRPPIRSK